MSGRPTREQVMNALLARIQAVCGVAFATYSRRFQTYDDLVNQLTNSGGPAFPALYLYDGVGFGGGVDNWDQGATQGIATPVKVTLWRTVVIYALKPSASTPDGTDMTVPGASTLNPLIESVEAAFVDDTPSLGVMTLNGLVKRVWIEGDGFLIPGDIDQSGLAMQTIPVRILIP